MLSGSWRRDSMRQMSRCPDAAVVGEVNQPWIEPLEDPHPLGNGGQRPTVAITVSLPRELVGRVLRGGVVALTSYDYYPVRAADDQ